MARLVQRIGLHRLGSDGEVVRGLPVDAEQEGVGVSFNISPHLEHIEWEDGMKSYCRPCDASVPFIAIIDRPGYVTCEKGHKQHAGNLILNGARK